MMAAATPSPREHGISVRIDYSKIDFYDGEEVRTLASLSDNPSYFNTNWTEIEKQWKDAVGGIGSLKKLDIYYEHPVFSLLPNHHIRDNENYLNLLAQDIDSNHLNTSSVDDLMSIQFLLPIQVTNLVDQFQPETIAWHILPIAIIKHCKQLILEHVRVCMLYASTYCYVCVVSPRGILFLNAFYSNDVEDLLYYVLTIKRMHPHDFLELVTLNHSNVAFDMERYFKPFFDRVSSHPLDWFPVSASFTELLEH